MTNHTDGEPMSDEAAAFYCELEAETCICPADAINDDCGWHGDRIWRDIESGDFWTNTRQYSKPRPNGLPTW